MSGVNWPRAEETFLNSHCFAFFESLEFDVNYILRLRLLWANFFQGLIKELGARFVNLS